MLLYYPFNVGDISGSTLANYYAGSNSTYTSVANAQNLFISTAVTRVGTSTGRFTYTTIIGSIQPPSFTSTSSGLTFTGWIYWLDNLSESRIIDFNTVGYSKQFLIHNNSQFYINGANIYTATMSLNVWYFVAWTISTIGNSIFVIRVGQSPTFVTPIYTSGNGMPTGTVFNNNNIGGDSYNGNAGGNCYMDDIRLYSRILSSSELVSIYNLT